MNNNKEWEKLDKFISQSCKGEKCFCGKEATNKLGEEILFDDPNINRHNLTSYVCENHFDMIMHPSLYCVKQSATWEQAEIEADKYADEKGKHMIAQQFLLSRHNMIMEYLKEHYTLIKKAHNES